MRSKCVTLTEANFHKEVLTSSELVVVGFSVDWLGLCHMMTPVIHRLAEEFEGRVKFSTVDTDEYPTVPADYGVVSLPAYLMFRDGKEIDRLSGLISSRDFTEKLEALLVSRAD